MAKRSFGDSEARKKLSEVTTYPYKFFIRPNDKSTNSDDITALLKKGKRRDGRTFKDHRKIYMKCGVVEDVRGSAYVEIGGTKVIASATGPVEMPQSLESEEKGFLNCEVKFSQFSCKSRDEEEELGTEIETVTDGVNRALEPAIIKEELGNVQLNIVVTVIESDGSVVSACVIAASLAVADGRIPMNDLVASVNMAVLPNDIQLIDPSSAEEELACTPRKDVQSCGLINLSYMASSDQVTDFVLSGRLEVETVLPSLAILKKECLNIYSEMQQLLKSDVKQVFDLIKSRNNQEYSQETAANTVRKELAKLST